jgi:hypothetical protein
MVVLPVWSEPVSCLISLLSGIFREIPCFFALSNEKRAGLICNCSGLGGNSLLGRNREPETRYQAIFSGRTGNSGAGTGFPRAAVSRRPSDPYL